MERKRNTLKLITWDDNKPEFELTSRDTTKIPDGNYKLKEGKFPLLTVDDLYEKSQKYHTLVSLDGSNEYKIKVTGFNVGCKSKDNNTRLGGCTVNFENEDFESKGGRRRRSKKRPTARRRRSSKARKSRATRRR